MPSFYVQNPWTGLVIDIGENATSPPAGTPLRANTKASPAGPFQLWEFVVPISSGGYHAIQNANRNTPFVVDIERNSQTPGARLDAYTSKGASEGNTNQLWNFIKDPETGYYFIFSQLSGLVIDIEERGLAPGQKPQAGAHLDSWTWKGETSSHPGNSTNVNQLWQFIQPDGAIVTPPPNPPPGGLGSMPPR
jgi:hypothetical protein